MATKADLTIRRAVEADIPVLMAIERQPGFEAYVGRSEAEEHRERLASTRYAYFLAERAGEPLGFAMLRDLDEPHGNLYLQRIAVVRPGEGLGGALLAEVIDWAYAHTRAHRFHLDCFVENVRAQAMYAKLGFTRDGVLREAYLGADGRRRDLALMALTRGEWAGRIR